MGEQGSLSVTEAASAIDVNPSTAQRILATLTADGFAVQGERKRYSPGPAFLRPGMNRSVPPLRERIRPHLERLFERLGETVHLATLVGTEIHHLDGIEGTAHPLRFGLRIGVRLPAHVTSAGKSMLAELSEEEVDARYRVAMSSQRGTVAVDLDALHQELAKTRRQLIGMNFEQSEAGVAAFGVSLGIIDGERAALTMAMPIARYSSDDGPKLAAALLETAEEVRKAAALDS